MINQLWKWKWKCYFLSHVWLFATPQIVYLPGSSFIGFSRQEYWSGLPFPSLGDLPNPGVEPRSPALQADSFPSEPPGKPVSTLNWKGWSLKLQCFGHLMGKANSLEKTLMLGKIEGKRKWRQQRIRWLDSITNSMDMNLSNLLETVKDRGAWFSAAHGVTKSQTQLSNWTTTFIQLF